MEEKQESKVSVYITETGEEVTDIAETELKNTTPILGNAENRSNRNYVIGGILAFLAMSSFSS